METREAACKAALVQGVQLWALLSPHFLPSGYQPVPRPRAQRARISQKWVELEPKFSYLPRTGLAQSKRDSWAGHWTGCCSAYPQLGTPLVTGGMEQEAGT